jgi:hypothetical protein
MIASGIGIDRVAQTAETATITPLGRFPDSGRSSAIADPIDTEDGRDTHATGDCQSMNLQDCLMGTRSWIERHQVGLFASIVVVLLGLVCWNQGRMARRIEDLSRLAKQVAKMPGNTADAERAIAQGREAVRKGQWDLGQIYLVNAITNAPGDIKRLREYATVVLERSDSPIEAVDRLSSMLQLAAYQVDTDEVPTICSLIEKAERTRKRLLEEQNGRGRVARVDLQSESHPIPGWAGIEPIRT